MGCWAVNYDENEYSSPGTADLWSWSFITLNFFFGSGRLFKKHLIRCWWNLSCLYFSIRYSFFPSSWCEGFVRSQSFRKSLHPLTPEGALRNVNFCFAYTKPPPLLMRLWVTGVGAFPGRLPDRIIGTSAVKRVRRDGPISPGFDIAGRRADGESAVSHNSCYLSLSDDQLCTTILTSPATMLREQYCTVRRSLLVNCTLLIERASQCRLFKALMFNRAFEWLQVIKVRCSYYH